MGAAPFRRLFGVVVAALALLLSVAPADAQQCVSSCSRGRGVCAMQAHAALSACLAGCTVGDTHCHTSCMAGLRTAQAACQMSRADCMTSCPTPGASSTSCVGGCSATARTCFMGVFSTGATCVQTCQTAGGAGLKDCLQQCAATIRSSGATCLAAFQSCVGGCQGQVTGGCFDTMAMECTTQACSSGTPCTQPNEFCSARCATPPANGTCLDLGTLQCTDQTCSASQPCTQTNQVCVPVCPPPVPQGHCFDPTTKQCTDQACDPAHRCSTANQICTLQCPMSTPTPQCASVPCGGPCVVSPTCPPGALCPDAAFVVRKGECESDAAGNCGCVLPSPQPTETPAPQCASVPCGGPCVISPTCPPGEVCPEGSFVIRKGECEPDAAGNCGCVLPTPQPSGTPAPTPTPQCSDVPCGGDCTVSVPFPCPEGKVCNPDGPVLKGQCTTTSSGSCDCVPIQPTPASTPTPQCSGATCGGSCVIISVCPPGEACPDFVEQGQCALDANGSCMCMPPSPPPTPTPQCSGQPCGGTCIIGPPFPCPAGKVCNGAEGDANSQGNEDGGSGEGGHGVIALQGQCTLGANGGCDCVPVQRTPRSTPTPQCGGAMCGGSCLLAPPCPSGVDCAILQGHCALEADGSCACMPPSPRPTATPLPTTTPQCADQPCGGTCVIRAPVPCPLGHICNGPDGGVELQGQCTVSASGSCDCVLVQPTPPATATPQCSGATCGGQCIIGPVCHPGQPCPEYASRIGECSMDAAGACQCMPVQGATPTPGCTSDDQCDDGIGCTVDRCDDGVCEHVCICLAADGSLCCGGPGELCVAPCGSDAAGTCGGSCPNGSSCESASSANTGCACVSGPGGPCGGNISAPPPVCAPGLVCHQSLPDVTGYCEKPDCVPLFMSGCSTTSDCCEPCENGTHAPCGVCSNGICEGAP